MEEKGDMEEIERCKRAAKRMETLIDDILKLAREGETVEKKEKLELKQVVDSSWKNVDTSDASLKNQTNLSVWADESRLHQLLENMIRNAVEHGGENVTITVGDIDNGFYFEDDGEGISKEKKKKVFEAGYSSSQKGTGLGLNIVEEIAKAHGWEIEVTESNTGGARFEIRIDN